MAESDKGSVYRQEKWLEELDIQKSENATVAACASRLKIQLEEPEEESQLSSTTPSADGTWKTISGRAIALSEKLLEKLDESVSCRFCQGRVQVMEDAATKHGLGSTQRIQCENKSCPSHKTNSVFNSSEKSRAFEIDRASVLGLRAIGGFTFVRVDFALVFGIFTNLANISRNKHNIFLLLHENRIVVCKLNDYYAFAFTYFNKFCLLSTRGVIELTGSKIIYISRCLPRKFCSCYMLPVKVLLLEKIDPSLISIRINI